MTQGFRTVIFPVSDITRAKALYSTLLGIEPSMDEAYYAGYVVDGQDIGLDPNGHKAGLTGPLPYWHVDDIEQSLKALEAIGAEEVQAVREVGGGRLIASVKDTDGNIVGLLQDAR